MRRFIATCFGLCAVASAQAATYQYTGAPFTVIDNHTSAACPTGGCADFTGAMAITGTFSTAPLGALLPPSDITAKVTSFSFSDGLTTYNSGDPLVRLVSAVAETDDTGTVTFYTFNVMRWRSGMPQTVGGYMDALRFNSVTALAVHNRDCTTVTATAQGNACVSYVSTGGRYASSGQSAANATLTLVESAAPVGVPTLSSAGLAGLSVLLGLACGRSRRGSRPTRQKDC